MPQAITLEITLQGLVYLIVLLLTVAYPTFSKTFPFSTYRSYKNKTNPCYQIRKRQKQKQISWRVTQIPHSSAQNPSIPLIPLTPLPNSFLLQANSVQLETSSHLTYIPEAESIFPRQKHSSTPFYLILLLFHSSPFHSPPLSLSSLFTLFHTKNGRNQARRSQIGALALPILKTHIRRLNRSRHRPSPPRSKLHRKPQCCPKISPRFSLDCTGISSSHLHGR